MMRIVLADSNHPVLEELLSAAGHQCIPAWDKPVSEVVQLLSEAQGLVIRSRFPVTKELLKTAPHLRCIGRVGAGLENIDLKAAIAMNVRVLCAPEGNRDAVAEHTVGMLLMLLNHLKKADLEVRKGIWLRAENRGTEICGKTFGIIGYGNMGSAVARRLAGFGCKVIAYDKYIDQMPDDHAQRCTLDELQQMSDFISLHVPLTDETRHMIDKSFIDECAKNFYLLNTSRGPCINTEDVVNAMKAGKIKGACLDVLEYEKPSFESVDAIDVPAPLRYLFESPNAILTPHIAGWTHESNYRMSRIIAEKMIGYFKS
jgi:D-3-phosphoglycerate dehydrogenase / 2-oxoglutarate reductase